MTEEISDAMNSNMVAIEEQILEDIVLLLLHGLTTDGAHHKQFYLEQALKKLCLESFFNDSKEEFQWEDGIPD